eukprot:15348458-Ditylum_brightwellii.AAC.1
MVSYNANSPMYNLAVPFYNTGFVEEWLKFQQNLQAVITMEYVTDTHTMYTIMKSMLQGDALMTFEHTEVFNRPQSEPNYKTVMQDMH